MTFFIICKLVSVIILMVPAIFAFIVIKRQELPAFFKYAFFATCCILLASLYYLALATDDSLTSLFNAGIFGEVAGFLFVISANVKSMNGEHNRSFSFPGLLLSIIFAVPNVLLIFSNPSFYNCLGTIIYMLVFIPCIYMCTANMQKRNEYQMRKAVFSFNLFTCFSILIFAVAQAFIAFAYILEIEIFYYTFAGLCALGNVFSAISIFVLYRGLAKWNK